MNIIVKEVPCSIKPRQTHCRDCSLNLICLPLSVQESELAQLDAIIERGHALPKGRPLFYQGQAFNQLFAVRSGAIKTTIAQENGVEQITGFYLPGEIIGLDSIGQSDYVNNAYALESTSVCAIPYDDLHVLGKHIPTLQDHILGLMSHEIRQSHQVHLSVSKLPANARIAAFLLALSARYQRRQLSSTHFTLPMSRNDIANYLGLTVETVSRSFTQLQLMPVIKAQGKDVQILDLYALQQLLTAPIKPE